MPTPTPTPRRSSIRRNVLVGFGLTLAVLTVISTVSYRTTRDLFETAQRVAKMHEIMRLEARARNTLLELESDRRSYVILNDERFIADYPEMQARVKSNIDGLKKLTPSNPKQIERLNQVTRLLDEAFALQNVEIEARHRGIKPARELFAKGRSEEAGAEVQKLLTEFEREENDVLRARSEQSSGIARANMLAIVSGSSLAVIGLLVACYLILADISARGRAEEALANEHNLLSSIIDTMPDHVFVKDVKGRYVLDNASHRRYLGVSAEHTVEGTTAADYYPKDAVERFLEDDRHVIETGKAVINHEVHVSRNGSPDDWVETTSVPLRDTDGTIVGLVGVSSDISERKLAEQKLKRFAGQLERSNAELQNFASVASHDLQEPLRKIQAFGDRLRAKCSDGLGTIGHDYLDRMQSAAQRMQVLIQDLLKLSRVTTRAQPFEQCDLRKIVLDVTTDLEVAIEKAGAKIVIGELPVIDGDPVQLWQLFQNLINNSLKFHQPGVPPHVEIAARIFADEIPGAFAGEKVCEITVTDNGIGFGEQFAEQIFEVFQRLHSRDEFEGTGIGLAVCRKITDRHGGRIVAKSVEGSGATFIVTLPIKQRSLKTHE